MTGTWNTIKSSALQEVCSIISLHWSVRQFKRLWQIKACSHFVLYVNPKWQPWLKEENISEAGGSHRAKIYKDLLCYNKTQPEWGHTASFKHNCVLSQTPDKKFILRNRLFFPLPLCFLLCCCVCVFVTLFQVSIPYFHSSASGIVSIRMYAQ